MLKKFICVPQEGFKLEEMGLNFKPVSREGNDII